MVIFDDGFCNFWKKVFYEATESNKKFRKNSLVSLKLNVSKNTECQVLRIFFCSPSFTADSKY